MGGRFGVGMSVLATGAVLVAAGCGGERPVTFQPIGGTGGSAQPSVSTPSSTAVQARSSTDPASGVVITRSGSVVCVRGPRGGTACTSGQGTVVVDGITVSGGVVVRGNGEAVSGVPSRPTKGQVRLSGAVTWSGTATGTCAGHGLGVRVITASLPNVGRLEINNVGDGVLRVNLEANGTSYGLNHVGPGGPARSTDTRTIIDDARLGKGSQVTLDADFDC
jgi:hypothetical protein